MELRRLRLVNFRQHADTEFELGPGITAIIGPNGVGKTTLLEAIAWAFYGNPAARGSRDTIRWDRAPARSQVRVEVDFRLGAHEYRVTRRLYDAQLFQDHGATPVSTGTQEVAAVVTRTLGMSRDEFFNTYFTGQKELAVMAALGPAERGRFLSRVLGYEKLRLAQDAARAERNRLRAELLGLEQGLGDAVDVERERALAAQRCTYTRAAVERANVTKEAAVRDRSTAGPEWTRMVETRQTAHALDGERRVAEHQVVDAKREFARLDQELVVALDAQRALKDQAPALAEVEPLRAELERLDAEDRAAGQRRGLTGQLREVESQRERRRARLAQRGDVAATVEDAERALAAAQRGLQEAGGQEEQARSAWVREKEYARTKREELLQQHAEIRDQRGRVTEAGPKGICPTCGRPLGADYEQLIATFTRQLEEIEVNGQYYKQRIAQLEAEPAEVQEASARRVQAAAAVQAATQAAADARASERERDELEREEANLARRVEELSRQIAALPEKYDAERHDQVRDRLKELDPAVHRAARLTVQAERAAALVGEMEAAEKRFSECEAAVKQLVGALADLAFSEERYQEARARYEQAEAAVHQAELEVVAQRGDLKAAEAALVTAAKRVEERAGRAARLEELRGEARVHDELDAAFADLRTDLNAQLRPELSDIASGLLADLTDGRYGELELDESYSILLLDDGMAKPVISGGEEDVANLALRLAISQLVAERAGQPLSLLVLDEIFGSLDEGRREQVVSLLRGLGDRFPQVVLITHIESVRDRVDRVLRVRLDPTRGAAEVTADGVLPELAEIGA